MNEMTQSSKKGLIRLSYLLPAISGGVMLILFLIPCMFFFYNGEAHRTWSLFGLLGNTWKICGELTRTSAEVFWFSIVMRFFVVLSFLAILGYLLMAIPAAICSVKAFSFPPTHPEANSAKRWLRFFCPNRITFAISNLLLLLPALFPNILLSNYRSQLGYVMKLYYEPLPLPLWLVAAVLIVLNLTVFFALLGEQEREQMDMFRLYKKK
jgi:hypothetical protein